MLSHWNLNDIIRKSFYSITGDSVRGVDLPWEWEDRLPQEGAGFLLLLLNNLLLWWTLGRLPSFYIVISDRRLFERKGKRRRDLSQNGFRPCGNKIICVWVFHKRNFKRKETDWFWFVSTLQTWFRRNMPEWEARQIGNVPTFASDTQSIMMKLKMEVLMM